MATMNILLYILGIVLLVFGVLRLIGGDALLGIVLLVLGLVVFAYTHGGLNFPR